MLIQLAVWVLSRNNEKTIWFEIKSLNFIKKKKIIITALRNLRRIRVIIYFPES